MSLFSKPKAVLWPKSGTTELYLDRPENNVFPVDIDLWKTCTAAEIQSLTLLFAQNKVDRCTILIPDDVVFTKSFIYDSEITAIDKSEVVGLAASFVKFKINPDYIDYRLIPASGKTIILSHIFDKSKVEALKTNLQSLKLKFFAFESVSQAISKVISLRFDGEYFLIYPLTGHEYTLLLSKKDSVYLTANLKGPELEVQKIINYSNLYFPVRTTKFYLPADEPLEISATSALDKTTYSASQIAQEFKKAGNLPLPVVGLLVPSNATPAIINSADTNSPSPNMEKNRNILPFIGVFIVTAIIASVIIWFVLSKNNPTTIQNPTTDVTPTIAATPTAAAVPTVAEISKKLKLQVLNGTDINGQAALLKNELTKLGFTSVTVGNSKESVTVNSIQLKSSLASDSAYFQQKLAGYFDAVPTTDLKANSTYDIVFTIGTDLSKGTPPAVVTPAATLAPTKKPTVTPKVSTPSATPTVKAPTPTL